MSAAAGDGTAGAGAGGAGGALAVEARKQAAGWRSLRAVGWMAAVVAAVAFAAGLWQSLHGAAPAQVGYTVFLCLVAGALGLFRVAGARGLRRAAALRILGPALAEAHPGARVDADTGLPAATVVAALAAHGRTADPARVVSSALAAATIAGTPVQAAWVRAGRTFTGVIAAVGTPPRYILSPDDPTWLRPDRAPPVTAPAVSAFVARLETLAGTVLRIELIRKDH